MEDTEVKRRIKGMLVERLFLDVEPDSIADDTSIMDEFDIDSVRLFEVVVGTEEVFDISFEDDDFSIEMFKDVNAIADTVKSKLSSD